MFNKHIKILNSNAHKKRIIQTIHKYLKENKYLVLFQCNKNTFGFKNNILLSNKNFSNNISPNKKQIVFLNYDYKNEIESFALKNNNPIQFPKQFYVEVEEEIDLENINFEDAKSSQQSINIKATLTKEDYIKKVNALKQHIQQGDIYEINYCITFEAHNVSINPSEIYQKLNAISNAPYSALAKFDKQYIISSSPELFLTKSGNTIITKPIKGTAKRLSNKQEDDIIKNELQSNLKERTENVMIVDVARNDLSRIAKKGSVTVDKLCDIESYQQVHQMVSTVSCELKENTSFKDIIQATFPMASMTGAPKIRAMQLIDEYELYNRGPYSGALGYMTEKGDFDLSVLIRSIFYDEQKQYLSFTVGSAITAMCNAEDEYEECLLKAKAMIQVLSS
jgi:para-aminobenzoate synthetase component 1